MLGDTQNITIEIPTVEIMPAVLTKLQTYVEVCPGEISGFGLMRIDEGKLIVDEVFIPSQWSAATSTEIDAEDLAAFLGELIERGVDPSQLQLYFHSHAGMDVFWSSTDIQTMESAFPYAPWILALVLNRRGALKACLHVYQPVRVRLDDLPVRLHCLDAVMRDQIRAEVRRKVRQNYGDAVMIRQPAQSPELAATHAHHQGGYEAPDQAPRPADPDIFRATSTRTNAIDGCGDGA